MPYNRVATTLLLLQYQMIQLDCRLLEQVLERERFRLDNTKHFKQLTRRETQILQLLASGLNNPMIAQRLSISRSTVETHRKNLNRKLELKSYSRLVKYALAFDLIQY